MITCPECGAENADGVKFCDRCGQGLSAMPVSRLRPSLPPLSDGTELKDGLRILELISQTSDENRYRAERVAASGVTERFQVRERRGDHADAAPAPETPSQPGINNDPPEPPPVPFSSATAKTAELKLKPAASSSHRSSDQVEALAETDREGASTIAPSDALPSVPANGAAAVANHADTNGQASLDAELIEVDLAAESTADPTDITGKTEAQPAPMACESEVAPKKLPGSVTPSEEPANDNLGEVFGRVLALSLTLNHPAF